jgi:hypothetical protein
MTLHLIMTCHVIIFCFLLVPAHAFLFATFKWQTALIHSRQSELLLDDVRSSLSVYTLLRMAGGWGKRKKELTPEESARGDGVSGERRGFDAYELQVRLYKQLCIGRCARYTPNQKLFTISIIILPN